MTLGETVGTYTHDTSKKTRTEIGRTKDSLSFGDRCNKSFSMDGEASEEISHLGSTA